MNILVIGVGSIGKRHIKNLLSLGQKHITAVDKNVDRLNECKALYSHQVRTLPMQDALSFKEYDVVFICTPPDSHLALLDKAIAGNCHCFVEKPFALTAEGIETFLTKAEDKGLKVMTGFNMRHLPLIIELKNRLAEGVVGRILSCRISFSSYMPNWHPQEDYRKSFMAFYATGGGALFDYVHGLDLAQWLIEPIEKLFCVKHTSSLEMETDDMAVLVSKTKSGIFTVFYFDFVDRVFRKTIDIVGTEGTIIWKFSTQETLTYYSVKEGGWFEMLKKADYDSCYVLEIKDFLNAINNNTDVDSNGYNGLVTMKLLDAARKSAVSGDIVEV